MKILSIGQFGNYGISNTCLHRNWTLHKLGDVTDIDSSFKWNIFVRIINFLYVKLHIPIGYVRYRFNQQIIKICSKECFDIIWIDKGVYILPSTLNKIKKLQSKATIIGYSPDNMAERHNQTIWFKRSLKYYDWYITTKSYIVGWFKDNGIRNVLFVNNAYEDTFHHPYIIDEFDKERLGGKVGFIGMWEQGRANTILYLAKNGIPIRVWGGGKWVEYKNLYPNLIIEEMPLFSEDYNKALSAFDISLCFLRKMNYDQQTTRTMEIPACGSMLMAERTDEHQNLFKDREEAVFFSSNEELLNLCRFYLSHEDIRKNIAENGRKRCITSGYSNYNTIKNAIDVIHSSSKFQCDSHC